jgi:hypothetical protein
MILFPASRLERDGFRLLSTYEYSSHDMRKCLQIVYLSFILLATGYGINLYVPVVCSYLQYYFSVLITSCYSISALSKAVGLQLFIP